MRLFDRLSVGETEPEQEALKQLPHQLGGNLTVLLKQLKKIGCDE